MLVVPVGATVSTVRVSGDGGVGTEYRTVSRFRDRTTELGYVVTRLVPGRQIVLRGENRTVVAEDTIRVTALDGGGSEVTYRAAFTLKGLARLAAPLLAPAFRRLGDDAEAGLRRALASLG